MRVLVTGAAGMLGADLLEALTDVGHQVTAVDMEVDVTNPAAVDICVDEARPEAVFHLAAWTDVDGAEAREPEAFAVNATGTRNVATAAARHGAPIVAVSTDYVFDGTAGPYTEDAPTSPLNAYGRTKLAGEIAALEAHPAGARIARTAWLYGAGGRNFVDTVRTLAATHETVRVVADQEGCPTWAHDLSGALIALLDQPPGIYHTAGGGSATWADLAEAVFDLAGLPCRVERIATREMPRPATRPARSILRSTRPGAPRLRPWRDALADYIREYPSP